MKSLLLVRHAKSSWGDFTVADFDRPLNDRGKKDAPVVAQKLIDRKIKIDAFVSSPAKRAKKTAQAFAEKFNVAKENIIYINDLYEAKVEDFFSALNAIDDRHNTIAIFSHNPGITSFANVMEVAKIDDMPTCAVFGVQAPVSHWKDFRSSEKKFWFFEYPKKSATDT
jgi:phosphohistidine phosphatase